MLIRFKTIQEAHSALLHDKLGTVYMSAKTVFITTAFGTGTFSLIDWLKITRQKNDAKSNTIPKKTPNIT